MEALMPIRFGVRLASTFKGIPVALLICIAFAPLSAGASSASPRGTKYEQHVAKENSGWFDRTVAALARKGVMFREPVHEEIANRIYECGDNDFCNDPEVEFAGPFVVAGVRWNDDPPFQLQAGDGLPKSCKTVETIRFTTQPICWYELFKAAKRQAESGDIPDAYNRAPLLARSHFGDLQFLHAMASVDGETAAESQKRVLMWAEFTWKVAIGTYKLDTPLKDVDVAGFDDFFGKSGWSVQDLFTVGNSALRGHIRDVAFGSNLHTVADSFAKGHVKRQATVPGAACAALPHKPAPGSILEFHSYTHQDEHKHAEYDTAASFHEEMSSDDPNEVLIGRSLREFYEQGATWETVKPYFECVFAVADPNTKASAGNEFVGE
jgi:hypothetical protein